MKSFFIAALGSLLMVFTGQAVAQDSAICEPFSQNQSDFYPCTIGSNIDTTIQTDPDPAIGDYLEVSDDSGPSVLCTGDRVKGSTSPYTGNWIEKVQGNCSSLCYNVRMFDGGSLGNQTTTIAPVGIVGPNGTQAVFRHTGVFSEDGGSNGGWHKVCLPVGLINAGDDLPSNSHGGWQINNSTAHDPYWNTLIQNVMEMRLYVDITSMPSEIIGFDNFCLGDCDDGQVPNETPWDWGDLEAEEGYQNPPRGGMTPSGSTMGGDTGGGDTGGGDTGSGDTGGGETTGGDSSGSDGGSSGGGADDCNPCGQNSCCKTACCGGGHGLEGQMMTIFAVFGVLIGLILGLLIAILMKPRNEHHYHGLPPKTDKDDMQEP